MIFKTLATQADMVIWQVKTLPAMLASHFRVLVDILLALLLTQFPANIPGKAVEVVPTS